MNLCSKSSIGAPNAILWAFQGIAQENFTEVLSFPTVTFFTQHQKNHGDLKKIVSCVST